MPGLEFGSERGHRRGPRLKLTVGQVAEKLNVSRGYATMLLMTHGNSDSKQCRGAGCKVLMFAHDGQKVDREFCSDGCSSGRGPARRASSAHDRTRRLLAARARYAA